MKFNRSLLLGLAVLTLCGRAVAEPVPKDIQAVFNRPMYAKADWALRVVQGKRVLIDSKPGKQFFIGSVRKTFTVGELLDKIGPQHTYDTPVYRTGAVDRRGVLNGNLVLQASGDLTMGGRTLPNGKIAYTGFDHNEADSLGNAQLTKPDPLAGYKALARQVAASGIKEVKGDVVIDDRLFQPFDFRGEFDVRPIYVNDDCVDLTIRPTKPGTAASVQVRPLSAALKIDNTLTTGAAGSESTLKIDPELPKNIGTPGATSTVSGSIPSNLVPPLTNKLPLVQTVRITKPSNYARTVFIECLQAAGVRVDAAPVKENPTALLPRKSSYPAATRVARLTGMPYAQDAELILKVSYNIGADTSLVLFGLTQGVNSMPSALKVEQKNLARMGIPSTSYHFVDGSGGGPTTATNEAITTVLAAWEKKPFFPAFHHALPILAVDGSLGFVTQFTSDPTLRGARGKVHAKTGTYGVAENGAMVVKGQAMAGYMTTRSGKKLIFSLVVNNVPVKGIPELMQIFQDQGRILAMLWRDN